MSDSEIKAIAWLAAAKAQNMRQIKIVARVVQNRREGHGWLPALDVNREPQCSEWASRGYTREEAQELALFLAAEESIRWGGDYEITIISDFGGAS